MIEINRNDLYWMLVNKCQKNSSKNRSLLNVIELKVILPSNNIIRVWI
jgi:hypothetical protein